MINIVNYDYIASKLNNFMSMLKLLILLVLCKNFIYSADNRDNEDTKGITIAYGNRSQEDVLKTTDAFVVPWTSEQMAWIFGVITNPENPKLVTRKHPKTASASIGIFHFSEKFSKDPVKLRFYLTLAYLKRCSNSSNFETFLRSSCPKPAQIAYLCSLKSQGKFSELLTAAQSIYNNIAPSDKNSSGFFMFSVAVNNNDKNLALEHAQSFINWYNSRHTEGLKELFDDRQVSDLYTSCAFHCHMPSYPEQAIQSKLLYHYHRPGFICLL